MVVAPGKGTMVPHFGTLGPRPRPAEPGNCRVQFTLVAKDFSSDDGLILCKGRRRQRQVKYTLLHK